MAEISTDTLSIDIESEASGDASSKIDETISKLQNLDTQLQASNQNLNDFRQSLQDVGSVNLSNLSNIGNQISSAVPSKVSAAAPTTSLTSLAMPKGNYMTDIIPKSSTDVAKDAAKELREAKKKADEATRSCYNLRNILKGVASGFRQAGSIGRKALGGIKETFSQASSGAKKLSDSLKRGFSKSMEKSIKRFGLAMIGVRSTFAALRKAISSYMEYDVQLGKSLQNNWAVLGSLMAPVLEKIIDLFSKFVAYIRAFVKALTGVDLVARANEKAMNGLGESAKETLGNLAKFDELNTVDFGKDKGSGTELPELTTPDVDVSWLEDLMAKLKSQDWYGLGMEIGRMINEALESIDIDWFIEKARQWGKNIADLFNGLTDGIDWDLLGEKIAGGLNVVLNFGVSFLENYNFENLGKSLATGINSIFEHVDWDTLGKFLGLKVQSLIDIIYGFVTAINWENIGSKLSTGFNSLANSIDLGKLSESITKGLQGILTSVETFYKNIDFDSLAENINRGLENMDLGGLGTALSNAAKTAFEKMKEFISQINWTEIGEQIGTFLTNIDWIGIFTSLLELQGNILLGLVELLWGFVKGLAQGVWDKLVEWFENSDLGKLIEGLFETVGNLWDLLKPAFDEIWTGISDTFTDIKDDISTKLSDAWDNVQETWKESTVGQFFEGVKTKITEKTKDIKEDLTKKFSDAWTDVKTAWDESTVKQHFENVKKKVAEKTKEIKEDLTKKFSDAWTDVKTAWDESTVKKHFETLKTALGKVFSDIGTVLSEAMSDKLKEVLNKVFEKIEEKVNGFIRTINKVVDTLNKLPNVKISKLSEISIPRLVTGTNRIESEGLYHLHEGEAVVPKKYNPAVNDEVYKPDNTELISEIKSLRQTLSTIEQHTTINLGNKTLMKETRKLIKDENDVYGERVYNF